VSDELTPKWGVEILVAIERLSARIEANDERHTASATWAERNILDHEKRMRSLEQFKWKIMGGAAVIGFLTSFVGSIIAKMISA
jgi:hypothetical protein